MNITAPTADDGPYEVGDAVLIELDLEGTDVATVTISATDSSQDARFTATVRDNDSSGNVTLSFDTSAFDVIETDGFVPGEGATLVNTSAAYSDDIAEAGLDPVAYNISVSPGEEAHDEGNGTLADRVPVQLIDPLAEISSPTSGASFQGNETVPLDLTLQDTDVGTLSVTFVGGENVEFTATVQDADNDGNATVTFDPAAVVEGNDAFSSANGTTMIDSSVETDGGSVDDGLTVPTLYDISVTPSDQSPDAAGTSPTDSLELVVTGGGEIGDSGENGDENGDENDDDSDGNGDENDDESDGNGEENGDESGENGDENGDESDENGEENGGESGENGGEDTPTDGGDDDTADGDGPGFGVVIALGALVALALGARLRSDG